MLVNQQLHLSQPFSECHQPEAESILVNISFGSRAAFLALCRSFFSPIIIGVALPVIRKVPAYANQGGGGTWKRDQHSLFFFGALPDPPPLPLPS